jgi:hypothetical protein
MAIDKRLQRIIEKNEKRAAERAKLQAELQSEVVTVMEQAPPASRKTKGLVSNKIAESVDHQLILKEQLGLFDTFPVTKKNICPTLLTRTPFAPPIKSAAQKAYLDEDNALAFDTPFGTGKRYGPNITIFDKRVLHALFRLRNKRLRGEPGRLPIQVSKNFKTETNGKLDVDVVVCTTAQILDEFGMNTGGENYNTIKKALKKLGACRLELTTNKHDRYLGTIERGFQFQLFDVQWEAYETDGVFYIQFSPLLTRWLEYESTYYDFDVSLRLGRHSTAIALHEFLSSQFTSKAHYYERDMLSLAKTIGDRGEPKFIKKKLISASERLVEEGWLTEYQLTGTGRKTPFIFMFYK